MKSAWPLLFILLCSFTLGKPSEKYDPAHRYSAAELREDLSFLRSKFEHHNPNLYLYMTPAAFDKMFDSLSAGISAPMTDLEFYRYIGAITSRIRDGHTSIFPNEDCEWWYGNQNYFLPLLVTCNGDKMITDLCASTDRTIPDGSEITRINGRTAAEILARMRPYAPRDGYNDTRVTWIINNFFAYFYCYCVENPDRFEIAYTTPDGQQLQHTQAALPVDSMWTCAYQFYPQRYNSARKDSAITLRFQNDSSIAILRIRTFTKGGSKAMGASSFHSSIHRYFEVIQHSGAKNLVIDVRDNGGGNPEYARYVISHLLDSSFVYIEEYQTVDRLHYNDEKRRTHTRWFPYCGIGKFKPQSPVYKHNLYVLMDGGSTSTAGDFVACLDYYNRATFIGEESGANKVVSGGNVREGTFELPNTKLKCRMSTIQGINKKDQPNDGHGVIPDYLVVPAPDDYIKHRNPMLEKALELIYQQKITSR
jgi:hypothetical protein